MSNFKEIDLKFQAFNLKILNMLYPCIKKIIMGVSVSISLVLTQLN